VESERVEYSKMNSSDDKRAREIIDLMRSDDATDAPQGSVKFAKDLFRTRTTERQPSLLKRIVASLSLDLSPGKTALAERSAGTTKERQMLFEAGENKVDLRVDGTGKTFQIKGQILGAGFEGGKVIVSGVGITIEQPVDELGDFEFNKLPAGTYELTISGDTEIYIPAIDLK